MQGSRRRYSRPQITDYGDLWEITATVHPLIGAVGANVNFSSPGVIAPHGATTPGGTTLGSHGTSPATAATSVSHHSSSLSAHGSNPSSSAQTGTTGDGSTGAAGGGTTAAGQLPFTGLAVGLVTGIGAILTAAGASMRRLLRSERRADR